MTAFLPKHIIETFPKGHPFTSSDGCEFLGVENEASTLIAWLNRVFFFETPCFFFQRCFEIIFKISSQKKPCNNQFFVLRFDDNWPDSHLLGSFAYHLA